MSAATDVVPDAWRSLDLAAKARLRWRLKARPKQLTPPTHALCEDPEMCEQIIEASWKAYPHKLMAPEREYYQLMNGHIPWFIWLILAGRGWGKTRTGAEDIAKSMLEKMIRVALVAPTFGDGRDTMVEGESGLKAIIPSSLIENWNRSIGELILVNGSRAKIFSAEEPQRLRGPQHNRAWCDEIAAWRYIQATWDMLMFGLRLGRNPQVIITTTPKPYRFIRRLVAQSMEPSQKVIMTSGSTFENQRNLPTVVINKLTETYEGTRLGRQELDAEVLEDLAGGIIKVGDIDAMRLSGVELTEMFPTEPIENILDKIVVSVDPAVTAKKTSNETGIVVVGCSHGPCPVCTISENPRRRPHAFVLEDATLGKVTEHEWSSQVVSKYRRWMADEVVAEVNNGGDLVIAVMRAVDGTLPVGEVRASRGKVQRAEPIGALYERHEVHHVGRFPRLEDQLCNLGIDPEQEEGPDPDNEDDSTSPDRADAAVWGLTALMIPETRVVHSSGSMDDQRGQSDR